MCVHPYMSVYNFIGGSHSTHLIRDGQQHPVQLLHQLFEGRPLGGNSMPALTHHHVAARGATSTKVISMISTSIYKTLPGNRGLCGTKELPAYSSCVQLEGLSMRCPSFSSLKSSSTGIPGYGEPPSVKISHISTPNDHLAQTRGETGCL